MAACTDQAKQVNYDGAYFGYLESDGKNCDGAHVMAVIEDYALWGGVSKNKKLLAKINGSVSVDGKINVVTDETSKVKGTASANFINGHIMGTWDDEYGCSGTLRLIPKAEFDKLMK